MNILFLNNLVAKYLHNFGTNEFRIQSETFYRNRRLLIVKKPAVMNYSIAFCTSCATNFTDNFSKRTENILVGVICSLKLDSTKSVPNFR